MDKCTILLEDTKSELSSTKVEPGLSFFIEAKGKRFLFNCGPNELFLYNARIMNTKLNDLDFVSLSQSSYEHSSGFLAYIKDYTPNHLIIGNDFFLPKYAKKARVLTYLGCGFDRTLVEENNIKVTEVNDFYQASENIYFMNNFNKRFSFENIPSKYVHIKDGELENDNFFDELALIIDNGKDLTVITAFSHQGILSMVSKIREHFKKNIVRIIGGINLADADDYVIDKTANTLVKFGVKETFLCHSSGPKISEALNRTKKVFSHNVSTGDIIKL